MINISIITQDDKFFIPKNISLLIECERIRVKSIHTIDSSGALNNRKAFFLKSFLYAGGFWLGFKYFWHGLLGFCDMIFGYKLLAGTSSIRSLASHKDIEFSSIKNPNDVNFIKDLKSKNLDFIVSYSAPSVFGVDLLSVANYNCINLHCSLLPSYPGIMPSFWVLYFDERYTGCTVHLMDSKIDNGYIVLQQRVKIGGVRSIFRLNQLTKEVGGKLMLESILGLVDGRISLKKNKVAESNYFTWPKDDQIKRFIKNGGKIF